MDDAKPSTNGRERDRGRNAAEAAAGELNRLLECILAGDYATEAKASASLTKFERVAEPVERRMPGAFSALRDEVQATVRQAFRNGSTYNPVVDPSYPPRLIRGWKDYNIVSHLGRFSAIPLAAGPIDLTHRDPGTIEGALVSDSYASLFKALQSRG